LLRKAAPHPGILSGGHGPLQALTPDVASEADSLRRGDLTGRGAGGADGKEEFRILVLATRAVYPVHHPAPPATQNAGTELLSCCPGSRQGRAPTPERAEGVRSIPTPFRAEQWLPCR